MERLDVTNPKVSMIIPIYNAGLTLTRCVESVLGQTYSNLDVILVDDGSTDDSGAICDDFSGRDRRVQVIHQENLGLSKARNSGIKIAGGKYIQFVDSDDCLEKRTTQVMVKIMEECQASLCIDGYRVIDHLTGKVIRENYFPDEGVYNLSEFRLIFHHLYLNFLIHAVWNKLYRTDLIKSKQIWFDPGAKFAEDLLFNIQVIKQCQSFAIIKECLYNYTAPWSPANLTSNKFVDPYHMERRLFREAMSFYHGADGLAGPKEEMETSYAERLVFVVARRLVGAYRLREYPLFRAEVSGLRADNILKERINKIRCEFKEDRVFKCLLEHKLYLLLFIYPKLKQVLINRQLVDQIIKTPSEIKEVSKR